MASSAAFRRRAALLAVIGPAGAIGAAARYVDRVRNLLATD